MPPSVPGHVVPCGPCNGLGEVVRLLPRPPPTWPSMMIEVGMLAAPLPDRLLTSVIVNLPAGTVIRGGCQLAPVCAAPVAAAQLAPVEGAEAASASPQV